MIRILLLTLSLLFTQELTVDGNLNVTGNIQNQTIDSLQQVITGLQAQITALQGSGGLETRLVQLPTISFDLSNSDVYYPINLDTLNTLLSTSISEAEVRIYKLENFYFEDTNPIPIHIEFTQRGIASNGYDPTHWVNKNYYISSNLGLIRRPNTDSKGYKIYIDQNHTSEIGVFLNGHIGYLNLVLAVTSDFSNAPIYQAPAPHKNK